MKLTHEQTTQRLTRYITEKLIPVTQNPLNKFKLGFAIPIVPQMVAQYWEQGAALGIIDEHGLDTERLAACLESGLKQVDAVTVQGFRFNADDVACLMTYLNA